MSLGRFTWLVARDVNGTVGGGIAAMELLRRTGMAAGWLDEDGHALLTAVSRLTPGTNVLAYCVALGWRVGGLPAATAALLVASVPVSLVIAAIVATLGRVDQYRAVQVGLAIGTLVAALLVLASAWALLRPHAQPSRRVLAGIVGAVAVFLLWFDVTPVRTLLAAAVIGALVPRR